MRTSWLRSLASHPLLRVGLAVILIIVGLAPIGVPILSDASLRTAAAPAGETISVPSQPQAFVYRFGARSDVQTQIERSDDGGLTWYGVASIPALAAELQSVKGDEQVVYARTSDAVWVSHDGGGTWVLTTNLPSRPLALAVTSSKADTLLVGTESRGLVISRNGGEEWQVVNDPALTLSGAAPVAVTAIAVNPDDETIVYASTGAWTGTGEARLNPVGTYVSLDGGRAWIQMASLPLSGGPAVAIHPISGRPMAVVVDNSVGSETQALEFSPGLPVGLTSEDPALTAAVARALGLLGDPSAVPALMASLGDEDALVGDRVVEALARFDDPGIVPALIAALQSNDETMRARGAYGLGLLRTEPAVDLLAQTLVSDTPAVTRRAAEALAAIGTPNALAALTRPLADGGMTPARHAAMAGLERAGATATPALVAGLGSQDPVLRANSAEMLGWIKSGDAVGALATALKDPDPAVRQQAAWALGEVGSADAQTALAQAELQTTDAATKSAVVSALQTAERSSGNRPTVGLGAGIMAGLSRVPATSWTFFGLFLMLAVASLLLTPRAEKRVEQRVERRAERRLRSR